MFDKVLIKYSKEIGQFISAFTFTKQSNSFCGQSSQRSCNIDNWLNISDVTIVLSSVAERDHIVV